MRFALSVVACILAVVCFIEASKCAGKNGQLLLDDYELSNIVGGAGSCQSCNITNTRCDHYPCTVGGGSCTNCDSSQALKACKSGSPTKTCTDLVIECGGGYAGGTCVTDHSSFPPPAPRAARRHEAVVRGPMLSRPGTDCIRPANRV